MCCIDLERWCNKNGKVNEGQHQLVRRLRVDTPAKPCVEIAKAFFFCLCNDYFYLCVIQLFVYLFVFRL